MSEVAEGSDQRIEPEPPYGPIIDELRHGRAIPFLGAGASRVNVGAGEPHLPSGSELAAMLADYAEFPSNDTRERGDLSKVSSYLVDAVNRQALRTKLHSVFASGPPPVPPLHRLLAALANNLMIITTNYDTLLERAFTEAGKAFDVVVYPADNKEFANGVLWWAHGVDEPRKVKSNEIDSDELGRTNLIYKMHGSVRPGAARWDSYVITEEDYVTFLAKMKNAVPPAFRTYLSHRAFLFLGYGLQDWNLRVLLKQVSNPDMTSWAILQRPSAFERALWRRRKVDIFDMKVEAFVAALERRMATDQP
jgi:SIR2-like domain